jgi:hypothetical protein
MTAELRRGALVAEGWRGGRFTAERIPSGKLALENMPVHEP